MNRLGLGRLHVFGLGAVGAQVEEDELILSGSSRRHRGRRQHLPDWIRQEDEEITEIIVQIVLSGALDR